MVKHVEM